MSHGYIVCETCNHDNNSVAEIAAAVCLCNASEVRILDDGVVEATLPSAELAVVSAIEGVRYVRPDFTYHIN